MGEREESPETLPKYTIRAFKATDDYEACMEFYKGHTQVLADYGIKNLNTAQPEWITNDNVYVVIATDESGEVVGGLRVHKYAGDQNIPLIDALKDIEPRIIDLFEASLPLSTAEVCGLWNSRKVFGKGISPLLCFCSVVVVKKIGLKDFYCFSAPYTEKMIRTNGLINIESIGDKGRFNYPTEQYISIVLYNPDVDKLEYAHEYNKSRILSLYENPNQTFIEQGGRTKIEVTYSLSLVNKSVEESAL
ncbi:MAG TPA: hypothetical protein VIK71_04570 [Flavobacteriales bacterium]